MLGYMLSLSEVLTVTASLTITLSTSYTASLTVLWQADGTTWWHNVGFEDGSSYQVTW